MPTWPHAFAANRGHLATAVGITTTSALITRKQLNPYEEACAVKAMLARGLTEDGAAQALGWPKQRVTARVKLLELPELAQRLIGEGELPLASVDTLRRIGEVSKPIQDLVIEYVDHDDTASLRDRLETEPAWLIGRALQDIGSSKTFAAYLTGVGTRDIAELKLGKQAEAQSAEFEALYKELNPYGYSTHPVHFSDLEIDQACAAGVLIEFEHGSPMICDRKLYRELVKQALIRSVDEYRDKVTAAREAKNAERKTAGKPVDPLAEAKRTHRQAIRELSDQAHGVNLDLGAALINGLSRVDPNDMDVARFFVLCGRPHRTNYADGPTMPRAVCGRCGQRVDGGLLGLAGCLRVGIVSRGSRGRRGRRRWACSGRVRRRVESGAPVRVL
jgi:hypothetical protein